MFFTSLYLSDAQLYTHYIEHDLRCQHKNLEILDFYLGIFYNPIRKEAIRTESVKGIVSSNLRRVCKLKGIKSKDVAAHMGVSESAVSHWFKGDNAPDIDNLYEICQFIGVSLDQIFGIDPIYFNTLSEDENNLIIAFRKAGEETKENIRSILKLSETKKETDVSAI